MGRHHVMVATTIDTATKGSEAWRATTPPEVMKDLGLSRPLLQVRPCIIFTLIPQTLNNEIIKPMKYFFIKLSGEFQSTVKVEQCVAELRSLMIALPLQGEHFCTLALNVLHNYRETCNAAYRGIIQPDSEDKRICSAAWLKDDDISRFIKYVLS